MSVQTCSMWSRQSCLAPSNPVSRQPSGTGRSANQIEYCSSSLMTTRYLSGTDMSAPLRPGQPADRGDGSGGGGLLAAAHLLHEGGHPGHGRHLEEAAHGQPDPELLPDERDELAGDQRVAAQVEE